jgi:hypothetical protein
LPPNAIIFAGETGEPRVRDGQDFFRPRNPSLSGQRFLPDFAHLARGATDAGGCGVTKHVLVAHVPEPQDPDGVTELARFGSRFGDHVVANPEADVPELPGFALYREARAAVLRCVSKQGVFLIRPDGYIRLARPFVPRART